MKSFRAMRRHAELRAARLARAQAREKEAADKKATEQAVSKHQRFARARSEHRAGSFFLYNDAPIKVKQAIGERVLVVQALHRSGFIEVHGWCDDFDQVVPGDVLPHYRWMYDTSTFEVQAFREERDNERREIQQAQENAAAHAHEEGQRAPLLTHVSANTSPSANDDNPAPAESGAGVAEKVQMLVEAARVIDAQPVPMEGRLDGLRQEDPAGIET